MEQTIITLLIAAGGAVFGVLVIAGGYLAARAAMRDANGVLRKVPAPEPKLYVTQPEPPRRSGGKPERVDPVRVRESMILELQRTRSILLGWLSVLEAFALGDAWRATALRAELGDINTCDVSLVGDANLIATYQLTVDMLRNQAGRGLPPDVASQMASIRVRLLTALAEQERRLTHGEKPQIAEPLGHLDLWGPPRPITEVITRPNAEPVGRSRPAGLAFGLARVAVVWRPVTPGAGPTGDDPGPPRRPRRRRLRMPRSRLRRSPARILQSSAARSRAAGDQRHGPGQAGSPVHSKEQPPAEVAVRTSAPRTQRQRFAAGRMPVPRPRRTSRPPQAPPAVPR